MPSRKLDQSLASVLDKAYPQAIEIRNTIQSFIDDKILIRSRPSLTTKKVLDYHEHPRADQKITLSEICAFIEAWSDFLFKQKLIEEPIWEHEDSEFLFGLNNEKRILKYEDLKGLFQRALHLVQTIIDLNAEEEVVLEKEEKREEVAAVEKEERPTGMPVLPIGGREEEKKKAEEREGVPHEEIDDIKRMSASMRREQLRIQEAVLYAIANQAGIPIDIIRKQLSAQVSQITLAALYRLPPEDLEGSLLDVTKKMRIYRDILRNTEVIALTQRMILDYQKQAKGPEKDQVKEKTDKIRPQDILEEIERRETDVIQNKEYQKSVADLLTLYHMPTGRLEQTLREMLRSAGIPESDVVQIIARTRAYALSRKRLDASIPGSIQQFLLPIIGERGIQKLTEAFGDADSLAEIFEVFVEKVQIDWNIRTRQTAILFSSTDIPPELVTQVSSLIRAYGERSVGYAFMLSSRQISEKKKEVEDLIREEPNETKRQTFREELDALLRAEVLRAQLLQDTIAQTTNPFVRTSINEGLGVGLATKTETLITEQVEPTEDVVFILQSHDLPETWRISWEEVSEVPYAAQPVRQGPSTSTFTWDSLKYRLAMIRAQQIGGVAAGSEELHKVVETSKKLQRLATLMQRARILRVILTVLSAILPHILLFIIALSGALALSSLFQGTAQAAPAAADAVKSAYSRTTSGISNTLRSAKLQKPSFLGTGTGVHTELAPSTPFSLGTFFTNLFGASTATIAGTTAVAGLGVFTVVVSMSQTSSFLADTKGTIPLESEYIAVTKSATSTVPFDNPTTNHLPNEAAEQSVPISYSITIQPEEGATLTQVRFTDTTKDTARGPNYNDLVRPPVYDVVVYQGPQIPYANTAPPIQNGVEYPGGTSDITIGPEDTYTITYTVNLRPEFRDSLLVNTIRVRATVQIPGEDGEVTTRDEETGTSLTIRIGNPPILPVVQYAKTLAQAIYDNDPADKQSVTGVDFNSGLTEGLIQDGFENVVGILRASAQNFTYLQCVGFVQAVEQGTGSYLQGVGKAASYATVPVPGYTFYPNGSGSPPIPGDLAVFTGGGSSAGHIGLISEVNAVSDPSAPFFFRLIDANWNLKGIVRGSNEIPESPLYASNTSIAGILNFAGYLRRD